MIRLESNKTKESEPLAPRIVRLVGASGSDSLVRTFRRRYNMERFILT